MANRNDRNDEERGGWERVQRDFGRYQSGDDLRREYGEHRGGREYGGGHEYGGRREYGGAREDEYRSNDRNSSWLSREIDRQDRGRGRSMQGSRDTSMMRDRDDERSAYDRGRRDDDDRGRWMNRHPDDHERGRWMQGGRDPDVRGLADRGGRDDERSWTALDQRSAQRRNEHIQREERHHDDHMRGRDQQRWMGDNRQPLARDRDDDDRWEARRSEWSRTVPDQTRSYGDRSRDYDRRRDFASTTERSDNGSMRSGYQHTMGRGDESRWNRGHESQWNRGDESQWNRGDQRWMGHDERDFMRGSMGRDRDETHGMIDRGRDRDQDRQHNDRSDRGRYVSPVERMNRGPEDFDRDASRDLHGHSDYDRDRDRDDGDRSWIDRARDWFRGDRDDRDDDDRFASRGRH